MTYKILGGILAVFSLSNRVAAQQDSNQLNTVVIQENRLQIKELTNSTILLKMELAPLQSHKSVADLLSNVNGVDMRQRGPAGIQSDVSIRGGSFDQTQILLNGLKMNDPQTGHHNMNLPLPEEAISEIIVAKNSAARKYGLNAYSGYVNILTQVPKNNMVYAGVMGGEYGLFATQLGAAWHVKNWAQHIAVKQSTSDGYTTNTDFKTKEIFYQSSIQSTKNQLDVFGGYAERAFGARGFYVPKSTEFETTKNAFIGIKDKFKINNWHILTQAYWRNNGDQYIYLRNNPAIYENQHYTNTMGLELHATHYNKLGQTGIGIDIRNESISSYNYSSGKRTEQLGIRDRNIQGLFVEHAFNLFHKKLFITPGVYVNLLNNNQLDFFPGFDAQYKANSQITLFATLDNALRLPTYTDLYYKGPANIGNSALTPEKSINSEIGIQYKKQAVSIAVSYFNRYSNNTIDWAKMADSLKWQPLNVNHLQTDGMDASVAYYTKGILNKLSVDYTYIDMKLLQSENYKSYYALTNLKHQLIIKAAIKLPKSIMLTLSGRHIERVSLVDYQLLDARLSWQYKGLFTYVDMSNILNKQYTEAGYVQMPGRWLSAGIQYKLVSK